jgi:phosphatidylserine/phosphatidylglycerophosphate/cardiolipin synthase-like enzyme
LGSDDPHIILSSSNWTKAGADDNDENMPIIIHDRALAQVYHAEWQTLWAVVLLERICNPHRTYLPMALRSWPSIVTAATGE